MEVALADRQHPIDPPSWPMPKNVIGDAQAERDKPALGHEEGQCEALDMSVSASRRGRHCGNATALLPAASCMASTEVHTEVHSSAGRIVSAFACSVTSSTHFCANRRGSGWSRSTAIAVPQTKSGVQVARVRHTQER